MKKCRNKNCPQNNILVTRKTNAEFNVIRGFIKRLEIQIDSQNNIPVAKKTKTDSTNQRQSHSSWGIIHCVGIQTNMKTTSQSLLTPTATQQNKDDCTFLGELQTV